MLPVLEMKMVSSLEKCFHDDAMASKREKNRFIMFRNERLSFQVMYRAEHPYIDIARMCQIHVGGALANYAKIRLVANVLNMYPTYNINPGGAFLRTEPGAYPDMIRPLIYPDAVSLPHRQTHAIWVDIELPENFATGTYDISIGISQEKACLGEVTGTVRVVDAELPKQTLIHTEWFYTDCIANYYHCKAFSARHWKLIENFIKTAVRNGINMILTPVFTPELDTYIGGERLTTQLVEIERIAQDQYTFDFGNLRKWIELCLNCGVEYFEIPHFFSQWGAKATPKIIVKVNGKKKKYFGWHTHSDGAEYGAFLSQFIPALLAEFDRYDLRGKCYFHVSDEPTLSQLEQYQWCKERIAKYLEGCPIIDTLSDLDFYLKGVLKKPIPKIRNAMPFVQAKVPNLWVYYCGGGKGGATDRSLSMPSWRTRMLGVQLYYYEIEGFLHWGYNFYNSCQSYTAMDPYGYPDNGYFTPSGDCFLVYPGTNGEAWESLRLNALREAMDDIRALRLYERKFGREATEKLILEGTNGRLTFTEYPENEEYLINLREKIALSIECDH